MIYNTRTQKYFCGKMIKVLSRIDKRKVNEFSKRTTQNHMNTKRMLRRFKNKFFYWTKIIVKLLVTPQWTYRNLSENDDDVEYK